MTAISLLTGSVDFDFGWSGKRVPTILVSPYLDSAGECSSRGGSDLYLAPLTLAAVGSLLRRV